MHSTRSSSKNAGTHASEARGQGRKRRGRSASPMPPPAMEKRARTNDHPGLIGKRGRRTRADIAADKVAKEAEAALAAATRERTMTELAEMELEQEEREARRRKAIIWHLDTVNASSPPTGDGNQVTVDVGEDLTNIIDEEMAQGLGDDDSDESAGDQEDDDIEPKKKVGWTVYLDKTQLRCHLNRSPVPRRESC
jgi:hypothetical protein